MFDMITGKQTECPGCGHHFIPGRSNQEYCSRHCQKQSTQNTGRGFRHLENFARDELEAVRARDLREMLYGAPPSQRLGIMKDIIDAAYYDSGLRNILTRPELLSDSPYSAGRGHMNIAKAADAYCKRFLQMSVRSYVRHVRSQLKAKIFCELLDFDIEVQQDNRQCHGPVPQLRPKLTEKNVRCIHKILPEGDPTVTEADIEWMTNIVEEAEARVNTLEPISISTSDPIPMTNAEDEFAVGALEEQDAKRKIALSQACFRKGVSIDSHMGRSLALSMGIRSL